MATPNTTFVSGAILTATQQNNLAWGTVGNATKSADQNVTTLADVSGLSVAFTAVASRVYLVTVMLNLYSAAGASCGVYLTDGTTTFQESIGTIAAGYQQTRSFSTYVTGLTAGSKTLKIQADASASTTIYGTSIRASLAAKMTVIDIGAA